MIHVTRLQGQDIVLNCDHILYIELTPDTTIIFRSGQRLMVQEEPDKIIESIIEYRRKINLPPIRNLEDPKTDDVEE